MIDILSLTFVTVLLSLVIYLFVIIHRERKLLNLILMSYISDNDALLEALHNTHELLSEIKKYEEEFMKREMEQNQANDDDSSPAYS